MLSFLPFLAFILLLSTLQALSLAPFLPSPPNRTNTTLSLSIHIIDTTGKDISDHINILQHPSLFSVSDANQTQKRLARSHPVRVCPLGMIRLFSRCLPWRSPQAWDLNCKNESSGRDTLYHGNCAPDQLCVAGTGFANYFGYEASCISYEDFVIVAKANVDSSASGVVVGASQAGLPLTGVASSQYTMEAILTGQDITQSLNASSLEIQAQKSLNVHGHILWSTLPGGSSHCTECGTVSVDPVPEGTQRVALSVVVMDVGVVAGNLFLGSWIPGAP